MSHLCERPPPASLSELRSGDVLQVYRLCVGSASYIYVNDHGATQNEDYALRHAMKASIFISQHSYTDSVASDPFSRSPPAGSIPYPSTRRPQPPERRARPESQEPLVQPGILHYSPHPYTKIHPFDEETDPEPADLRMAPLSPNRFTRKPPTFNTPRRLTFTQVEPIPGEARGEARGEVKRGGSWRKKIAKRIRRVLRRLRRFLLYKATDSPHCRDVSVPSGFATVYGIPAIPWHAVGWINISGRLLSFFYGGSETLENSCCACAVIIQAISAANKLLQYVTNPACEVHSAHQRNVRSTTPQKEVGNRSPDRVQWQGHHRSHVRPASRGGRETKREAENSKTNGGGPPQQWLD
ncbi:hypothetical protein B0H17DRAFT_1304396 [Mycena rosella]|uniref:Uncharacterized protein n=1 Tax=Mycena rosella TaxID=1033263 RepID=A0AAD7DAY7_MYCRO|nr:hypothetical protein B0H17DRAFT_1304396 [Mycena rosella]